MTKKELETIKSIVNEVVVENNKVLLSRMESMEKQIKSLSVDKAVVTKTKATKTTTKTTTKSAKATTPKATKSSGKVEVKAVNVEMAEDLGYDVVEVKSKTTDTYFIRQTRYMKDRKYREEAMKNEGRLRTDEGFEKMKCYEFATLNAVKTALKAVKKSKDAYKKSVAKA